MTNEGVIQRVTEEEAVAVVRFALKVGEHLQINGGEVSRVEDTVQRICRAYGAARVDVFAITSVIVVTAIWSGGVVITQSRRVKGIDKNTTRLEAINTISREVCANPIPVKEAHKKLDEALEKGKLSKKRFLIGSLIATTSFAAFFGGDWKDVLVTFFVTFLIVFSQFANNYLGGNRLLSNVMCCFFASTAATLICFWSGASLDMVMAGCIMVLIPGISMTSAVENLILGDTLSGLLGLMEALITAVALAGGFMLSQMLIGDLLTGAPIANEPTGWVFWMIQVVTSFTGSIGFSLLFGLRGKQLPVAAAGASVTWG
ncbi:MAG: threonine/serine exporter family protein, partial [Clostridia bacterium]|nr:threonine/serine exporter family protein [Clostridia bacterium]